MNKTKKRMMKIPLLITAGLCQGGTLALVLGPEPNQSWGINELPPSVSQEGPMSLEKENIL
jgi:hypothetical protein